MPAPFSYAYVLLLLAFPGVFLLGRALAHAVTRDLGLRAVLPAGLALALWVLSVHVASLLAHTLLVGLPVGTLALSAAGVAAEVRRRRHLERDAPEGRPPSPWMWIAMAGTAIAIAPAAFFYTFHDELLVTGHMSMAAQMQNGIYPPRHLTLPELPLRYHYGFDIITASLTAILHLRVDRAIDVATMLLWCPSWCLLWVLGERLAGRAHAWLTPFVTLFAGGIPLACEKPGPSLGWSVLVECRIGGSYSLNAPIVSYFFQHPWALGIPVATTAVLLYTERRPTSPAARLAALGLVLAALSMSEIVLFAGLLPAIVVAEAWYEDTLEIKRALRLLVVALASLAAAKLLGGFFVSVPGLAPLRFVIHAGFTDTARDTLLWNLKNFSLLPFLAVAGFVLLRRGRLLFALIGAGAFLIVNFVRFTGSADIMKFGALASIALGVLASAALARVFPPRPGAGGRPSPARAVLAGILTLSVTWEGVVFLLLLGLQLGDVPAVLRKEPDALTPDDVEAVTFVRRRARAGEMVYRGTRLSHGYAQWGGLPQPWINWTARAFGFDGARLDARERLLLRQPPDVEIYRRDGFRWFVLDDGPEDRTLRGHTDAWIAQGKARLAATFGPIRVIEMLP
jgi:hypothetical protein